MIIDNFAGGGGASTGIEMALGRSPDIAINHDAEALCMHAANHPATIHLCESVWDVDIEETVAGRHVALAWFSPDCKHFSKAKGGEPVEKNIRGLAWIALKWAGIAKPDVIVLENVVEFQSWGPLVDNQPCPCRKGVTFKRRVTGATAGRLFGRSRAMARREISFSSLTGLQRSASTGRFLARPSSSENARLQKRHSGVSRWESRVTLSMPKSRSL
jgi:site-specific DNA-cytosine methylase